MERSWWFEDLPVRDLGVRRAAGLERVLGMHSVDARRGTSGLRPAVADQLLGICLQLGLGSAWEIARRWEWEPAFQ